MTRVKFEGIPPGRLSFTSVPNVLFSEWLPLTQDVAEVKVALHVFYLLSHKKGSPRFVTLNELSSDAALMQSLQFKTESLKRGLEQAAARGALLQAEADGEVWYFFNTPESRNALEKMQKGELRLASKVQIIDNTAQETPNIFKLYEQNIGALTPIIADELKEAEQEYPPEIILDAFRSAAENNKRSWRYVNKILLDWTRNNTNEKTRRPFARERRPSITGKLADIAKPK